MAVIYCYLKRENYKVLKFYMNNFSSFEKKRLPVLSATFQ